MSKKKEVSDFVTIIDSDISGFNPQKANKHMISIALLITK